MSYIQPNVNKSITDEDGKMLKGFRDWVLSVTRTQLFRSEGTPENQIEAIEDAFCIDITNDLLYYKRDASIDGDPKRGWRQVL